MNAILEAWFKVILFSLFFYATIQIISWIRDHQDKKVVLAARQAIRIYVHTGQKNSTFNSLGSPLTSTAERWRSDIVDIERNQRERSNTLFQSFTQCPKCEEFGTHYLSEGGSRECTQCGWKWYQGA